MDTGTYRSPGSKSRTWAVASLVLGVLTAISSLAYLWARLPIPKPAHLIGLVDFTYFLIGFFLLVPFGLSSLVTGIVGRSRILKEGTAKRGLGMAVTGIVLGLLGTLLGVFNWFILGIYILYSLS